MKKLILLCLLVLPLSALGNPAAKLLELDKEITNQGKALNNMAGALPGGANYAAAWGGSDACSSTMHALSQLHLHRATVQSGVKNTENYKLAHKFMESLFDLRIQDLTRWIAHATKAGVVAELRDCRKLFQKGLKVLQETRL